MASGSRSSPTEPLSVGNVVSTGFQLYRANAKQYLGIALISVGWSLLPILAMIILAIVAVVVGGATGEPAAGIGFFVLAFVVVIALAVYCFAKSLANSALISRLAFLEISNQSEDFLAARRFVDSRKWSFLFTQILVGLIVAGVFIAFYVVLAILFAATATAAARLGGGGGDLRVTAIFALLIFVLVIAALVLFLWLGARLFGAEVPLAVEAQSSASQSIGRFWNLTKGNARRVVMVLLVAVLVTLPIGVLSQLLASIPQSIIESGVASGSAAVSTIALLSGLISYAVSVLLNLLVIPFWQVVKSVVYYDLRNRREGLGLQLRER
ncbi:hypothetical protein OsccyDRAFT_2641 [Leptolyngbyaceae cyanobacterium JSC-12]|nr:hypothetical protein OsccyDRAFT_2641 [Leptolyngbyaceae cyanobacterium JSC-12]